MGVPADSLILARLPRARKAFCPAPFPWYIPAGDDFLKACARLLEQRFHRCTDVAARFGGEEFAVLLPDTPPDEARCLAENLRQDMENLCLVREGQHVRGTVSIGLAGLVPDRRQSPESLVAAADAALYQAKRKGRNRTAMGALPAAAQARPRVVERHR